MYKTTTMSRKRGSFVSIAMLKARRASVLGKLVEVAEVTRMGRVPPWAFVY